MPRNNFTYRLHYNTLMVKVRLLYVFYLPSMWVKLTNVDELEPLCDLAVRSLDEIIDHQKYPVKAAEISTKARRSLGIGYIGLAHYLAKKGYKYDQKLAWRQVDKLTEAFQFYLLSASNDLAKEKGQCASFRQNKICRRYTTY